jgi:translation initiation factor IF-1
VGCFNPANGFKFNFDQISKQQISGSTNHNDTKTTEKKIVTLKISPINSKGEVTFKFSEDVDV